MNMIELTQRIYVFGYQLMEDDGYEIVYETGIPVSLTEEELKWFAQKWKEGFFDEQRWLKDVPKSVQDKILAKEDELNKAMADHTEKTGCDDFTHVFNFMPLELELAVKQILGE